ncbi:MAG: GAF domain-containing protein [Candidatus Latescibacteria bacterium]|nr:GAF domain-containing protein [Candidatus Latescibacterota bacterium]
MKSDADELQQRNRELSILNAIARELNGSVDLGQALNAVLAQVAELLDLRTGWIWLLHEESGESYLAAAQDLPPALTANPRLMEEQRCYCLDTYRAGDLKGAANINVVACSRLVRLVKGTEGLRYHASIPLYAHEKKLGVLNVASADWRELSEDDLRLLHTIGDLLSIAVERARLFSRSVQLGAVEERFRLARELHDTLGQGLAAVLLKLEGIDALLEGGADPGKVRQVAQQTLELTRANLEEARRSVLDLRAAPLEGRTLAEALASLAAEVSAKEALEIVCEAIGGQPLPVRVEAGLYRIAQEALNNVVQHARARRALLRLVATPAQVQLVIEDDGCGFDPSQIPRDRYGLVGLNERARLLDGSLKIESSPAQGTRLEVVLLLEASG